MCHYRLPRVLFKDVLRSPSLQPARTRWDTSLYTAVLHCRKLFSGNHRTMPNLQVLLKKEDLLPAHLEDRVVIVLDILFATSTMVHAFSQGVAGIWPALNTDDANVVAAG